MTSEIEAIKTRISEATERNEFLDDLIGIRLFRLIEKDKNLSKELWRRINYFEYLKNDDKYKRLITRMHWDIADVLGSIPTEKIVELEGEGFSMQNPFKGREKRHELGASEFLKEALDKKSYYKLGEKAYTQQDEPFLLTRIKPVLNQYDRVEAFLTHAGAHEQKKVSQSIKNIDRDRKELEELLRILPREMHVREFQEFLLFCATRQEIKGYGHFYGWMEDKVNIGQLKHIALLVMEELLLVMDNHAEENVSTKVSIDEERGIYCGDYVRGRSYRIRGKKRKALITALRNGVIPGPILMEKVDYKDYPALSKEIKETNKLFMEKTGCCYSLIVGSASGGYRLNMDDLKIHFDKWA